MLFRLLRYMVRIWERWWKAHPDAQRLPLLIPIVLYHGAERWSAPLAFEDRVAVPDLVDDRQTGFGRRPMAGIDTAVDCGGEDDPALLLKPLEGGPPFGIFGRKPGAGDGDKSTAGSQTGKR